MTVLQYHTVEMQWCPNCKKYTFSRIEPPAFPVNSSLFSPPLYAVYDLFLTFICLCVTFIPTAPSESTFSTYGNQPYHKPASPQLTCKTGALLSTHYFFHHSLAKREKGPLKPMRICYLQYS